MTQFIATADARVQPRGTGAKRSAVAAAKKVPPAVDLEALGLVHDDDKDDDADEPVTDADAGKAGKAPR